MSGVDDRLRQVIATDRDNQRATGQVERFQLNLQGPDFHAWLGLAP